jgi:hypothetical protein
MCGLFGAVGTIDANILRTLALANSSRGNEALGFFDSTGTIWKAAKSPLDCLESQSLQPYLASLADCWFVAGHTRYATRGDNTYDNAHPFKYGGIVGSHNGVVSAPWKYDVDSMYLFDMLDKYGGDYQTAFEDIPGYWGLSWFDGRTFYLQAHNNTLACAEYNGCVYYSSDWAHLRAAFGCAEYHSFTEGETLGYTMESDGNVYCDEYAEFRSRTAKRVKFDCRTIGKAADTDKSDKYASAYFPDPFAFKEDASELTSEDWAQLAGTAD